MNARARVAWNLRRIRVERGLSQESLAVDADVDRSYISGMEQQSFNPTIDLLERLATALNIDVARLLDVPPLDAATPKPMKSGRRSNQ